MRYSTLSRNPSVRLGGGMADVTGWEVRTAGDNEKVGTVRDLVLDSSSSAPRYLEVDAGGFFTSKSVLLPIGMAQVDPREPVVWISGMTKSELKHLPAYSGDPASITDDYEAGLLAVWPAGRHAEGYDHNRFYQPRTLESSPAEQRLTLSEEELYVGKRAVRAGEVAVRKTVETERVAQQVGVMHEEVEIERRPVSGMHASTADIGADEIRVPLIEEELVVEKRPVVKEEIVIRKHAVQETKDVEADLRRERVDIDRTSGVERVRNDRIGDDRDLRAGESGV